MAFRSRQKFLGLLASSIVVILILVVVAVIYFPAPNRVSPSTSSQGSSGSANPSTSTSNSVASVSLSSTIRIGQVRGGNTITDYQLFPCNCTVYVLPQVVFQTLHDLVHNTPTIWLANVTSVATVSVKGVPFTTYNITDIQTLFSIGTYQAPPGTIDTLAWVGGTANGTTMSPVGYPTLRVGATYIFFLSLPDIVPPTPSGATATVMGSPFDPYWSHIGNGMASVTAGGAQGLFYVQDGKVFSLDNLYPQDDAWLPVKVDGMPLDQFISELQSA